MAMIRVAFGIFLKLVRVNWEYFSIRMFSVILVIILIVSFVRETIYVNKILTMKIYFVFLLATINNSVSFYINSDSVFGITCQIKLSFYDEIGCKPIGLSNNNITCTTK